MDKLSEKVAEAHRIIDAVFAHFRQPAVMWSSGKDSMVLLFLLRSRQVTGVGSLPVIWHREPWGPLKYEFGERIVREWGLRVYDWAPAAVTLMEGNGHVSLVNHYQVSRSGKTCALPVDIEEPSDFRGPDWVCGLKDVLNRPKGKFDYPWDVVLHGHKSSDVDPLLGAVPLEQDVVLSNEGAPAVAFPLRNWTDGDVWEFSRRYDVPQQWDRYDRETGKENPDRTTNPDYFEGCMRCIDRRQGATVYCPKLRMRVNNISGQMDYRESRPEYLSNQEQGEGN